MSSSPKKRPLGIVKAKYLLWADPQIKSNKKKESNPNPNKDKVAKISIDVGSCCLLSLPEIRLRTTALAIATTRRTLSTN